MASHTASVVISQDINRVYAIAATYPLFVDFYEEKEILYQNETNISVKISSRFFAIVRFTWEGNGIKEKNQKITWVQSKGLLHGLRVIWRFESLEFKTRVTIECIYDPHVLVVGKLIGELATFFFIMGTPERILLCLKKACESKMSNSANKIL